MTMVRRLLAILMLLALDPTPAAAFGESTRFRFAVLKLGAGESARVEALKQVAYEVRKRTSIDAAADVAVIDLDEAALFKFPFTVLPVCGEPPALDDAQVRLLRRYLDVGGFLWIDNCQGRANGAADRWVRAQVARLFPDRKLRPLPSDHSLTRSFYLLDRAYGRTNDKADLEGIDEGDRTVVLYHPNDLLGALLRDPFGSPIFNTPARERELAQRQGINIVLYALTLNYKKDQIHIPFILKRRSQ